MWWLKINEKSNSIHLRYLFNRSVVGSLCGDCSWLLFQAMVTNVSSLLKTVKSVEDKTLRGTRALESTTDAVKQAVLVSVFLLRHSIQFYQQCMLSLSRLSFQRQYMLLGDTLSTKAGK